MMRTALIIFTGLILFGTTAFISSNVSKSTARVKSYQGVYIFVDSEPLAEYEYIETVKITMSLTGSGQYTSVRDKLIKKAKKKYPDVEGIILHLEDGGIDRADVITFK